jgi:hypothetical protein
MYILSVVCGFVFAYLVFYFFFSSHNLRKIIVVFHDEYASEIECILFARHIGNFLSLLEIEGKEIDEVYVYKLINSDNEKKHEKFLWVPDNSNQYLKVSFEKSGV